MSDTPDPPPAALSFDRRFMRKGKHSVVVFLLEAYHAPIELVIAYWGNFESFFDACLAGLIAGERGAGILRDTKEWKRLKFKRRRAMFKAICSEWLQTRRPTEAKPFAELQIGLAILEQNAI
jgi:hypothetical protein